MPNVHDAARRWELDLAGRVGEAVLRRRKALGLTAIQLSELTSNLGYPITRVAISKIENNARAGKLDTAELLVLARALDLPPTLLLFPDFPGGRVEVLPAQKVDTPAAAGWVNGRSGWQVGPDNAGTGLVEDVASLRDLREQIVFTSRIALPKELREDAVQELKAQLKDTQKRITSARAQIWGTPQEDNSDA